MDLAKSLAGYLSNFYQDAVEISHDISDSIRVVNEVKPLKAYLYGLGATQTTLFIAFLTIVTFLVNMGLIDTDRIIIKPMLKLKECLDLILPGLIFCNFMQIFHLHRKQLERNYYSGINNFFFNKISNVSALFFEDFLVLFLTIVTFYFMYYSLRHPIFSRPGRYTIYAINCIIFAAGLYIGFAKLKSDILAIYLMPKRSQAPSLLYFVPVLGDIIGKLALLIGPVLQYVLEPNPFVFYAIAPLISIVLALCLVYKVLKKILAKYCPIKRY